MTSSCPTCPTSRPEVGQRFSPGITGLSDPSDLSDRKQKGVGENETSLSALAGRWRAETDHDEGEREAMRQHFAAPAGPDLTTPDPLAQGLLRGFHARRRAHPLHPSSVAVAVGSSTTTAGDRT